MMTVTGYAAAGKILGMSCGKIKDAMRRKGLPHLPPDIGERGYKFRVEALVEWQKQREIAIVRNEVEEFLKEFDQ